MSNVIDTVVSVTVDDCGACKIITKPRLMAVRSQPELRPYNKQALSSAMAVCYRHGGESGISIHIVCVPSDFHVACMNSDSEERT